MTSVRKKTRIEHKFMFNMFQFSKFDILWSIPCHESNQKQTHVQVIISSVDYMLRENMIAQPLTLKILWTSKNVPTIGEMKIKNRTQRFRQYFNSAPGYFTKQAFIFCWRIPTKKKHTHPHTQCNNYKKILVVIETLSWYVLTSMFNIMLFCCCCCCCFFHLSSHQSCFSDSLFRLCAIFALTLSNDINEMYQTNASVIRMVFLFFLSVCQNTKRTKMGKKWQITIFERIKMAIIIMLNVCIHQIPSHSLCDW